MRPRAFEDAILTFVASLSEAETICAAELAKLSEEDWDVAHQTMLPWLEQRGEKVVNWRNIIEMAEYERGRAV